MFHLARLAELVFELALALARLAELVLELALALAAGVAFHVLNGLSFGLAYLLVFGRLALRSRRLALASGVGWGLFLEAFQVTLYPGWLSIAAYREFVTISALGHVVYGATLGLLGRRVLGGLDSIAEEPLDG